MKQLQWRSFNELKGGEKTVSWFGFRLELIIDCLLIMFFKEVLEDRSSDYSNLTNIL